MTFVTKEKLFSREWFKVYGLIFFGTFIMSAGYVLFINPYRVVPGGVIGISIVIHYLTEGVFSFWPTGIPIGLMALTIDIPLALLGVKILGPRFGIKTVVGFVLTATFMDVLTYFIGQDDPLNLGDQILLASIFGGVLIGFGLGLIFRSRATTGGTDLISMMINKFTGVPLGQLLIIVDSIIVLLGLIAFGDWKIPLYSWIVIFITGQVVDITPVSYTHLRAHETVLDLVCRLLLEKKKHFDIQETILFPIHPILSLTTNNLTYPSPSHPLQ